MCMINPAFLLYLSPGSVRTVEDELKLMRLSCSHRVFLCGPAERKASAMVCNALHDLLINFRGDGLHLLVGLLQEIRELRQAIGQVRGQESLNGFLGHPVARS